MIKFRKIVTFCLPLINITFTNGVIATNHFHVEEPDVLLTIGTSSHNSDNTNLSSINFDSLEKKCTLQHGLISHLNNVLKEATTDINENLQSNLDEKNIELQNHVFIRTAHEYYRSIGEENIPYLSILSLDGGGIRGLMEAEWLNYLEKKSVTGYKIHELFNVIAGTSIGGILALASSIPNEELNSPALDTQDMINLFTTNGHKIFPQRLKYNYPGKLWDLAWGTFYNTYDEKPLEQLLIDTFSTNPLNSALTDVIVTTATTETQEPFLFSSLDNRRNHYEAWKIARATSAAPTYFKAVDFVLPGQHSKQSLIDGGLWLNNPAAIAFEVAINKWSKRKDHIILSDNISMLSLGTGKMPIQYRQPQNAGLFNSIRPIIESMMNYSTNGVDQCMKEKLGKNYMRINPKLTENISLDSIDQTNIDLIRRVAEDQFQKIDNLVEDGPIRVFLEKGKIKERNG